MDRGRLNNSLLLALALAAGLLLGGCGGHGTGLGGEQEGPAVGEPAMETAAPEAAAPAESFAELASPAELLKGVSGNGDTRVNGADFIPGWPRQRVAIDGTAAVYSPAAGDPPKLKDLAYACYRLNLRGRIPEKEVVLDWASAPTQPEVLWAGLSDWAHDRWVFFSTDDVSRVPVSRIEDYIDEDGELLLMVLLGGTVQATLASLGVQAELLDDWNQFGHDAQHTGRSPFVGAQTNTLKWKFRTTGAAHELFNCAVGADGTVYVGSEGGFYAINPDGSLKWSFSPGTGGNYMSSSPAIGADGTVYVGSDDDKLYAINPDGSLKWSYTTAEDVRSSPAIGADGTVYVGSVYKLYAINPDGSLKW